MQTTITTFLLLIVASFYATAQVPPKDVTGWGKVKWGMTLTEVKSAYRPSILNEFPGQAASCSEYPMHYCVPDRGPFLEMSDPTEIGDIKMHVKIQAAYKSTKIIGVELSDLIGKNGPDNFDTLKALLIQKYGAPSNQETKIDEIGAHVRSILWTLPSTAILLTIRQEATLFLEYKATDKKALDKL